MELKDKIALVTGSSRGIGRQIALEMAGAGADVAVHYYAIDSNNRVMAEEVAHEIVSSGRRALVVSGDVSDSEVVKDIVKRTEDELGPIGIMVNNAAQFLDDIPLWEISENQWDRVFEVNVKGPLFCVQATLPSMKQHKTGAIINISSLGSEVTMPGFAAYCSSKGALNSLTIQMALELAPWNIRANAIAPGHIDTEANLEWITTDPAREKRFRDRIALGRIGTRREIGKTAVFLASEGAGYINGQVIYADGGIKIWQGPIL